MSAKKKSKISQDTKDFIKEFKNVEETKVKDIIKEKKEEVKEAVDTTKDKAKEDFNVKVDEVKQTTKVIKDKVKDLPSEALDTVQTKVIDKVQDVATDYAISKVFKGNFFKRLIESVINKLKKI